MQFWCTIHQTNAHAEAWHTFAYRRRWVLWLRNPEREIRLQYLRDAAEKARMQNKT